MDLKKSKSKAKSSDKESLSQSKASDAPSIPPRHVAIIMDGNGRWAKAKNKPRISGHKKGAERVREVMEAACEAGVKYLTLFAFSSENWNRPNDEVSALMDILVFCIKKYEKLFIRNKIKFLTIGDLSSMPKACQNSIQKIKKLTENFENSVLVLALNYGARNEMQTAVRKIAKKVSEGKINLNEVNWDLISQNLDTADIPDPDLLIRTSGEMRLSNFLLMQSAYTELYFTDVNWPDFGRDEFFKAIADFSVRERRYGLTTEQLKK